MNVKSPGTDILALLNEKNLEQFGTSAEISSAGRNT